MPRVVILRGHQASPWELHPWELLPDRFQVACAVTRSNAFDVDQVALERIEVRSARDFLPGAVGALATAVLGDRYFGLERHLTDADIVHAEELYPWFTAQAVDLKASARWKLVVTVWETIPLLSAFRNRRARSNRRKVLAATELFLPATERARAALLLEGVEEERIDTVLPGVDVERFRSRDATGRSDRRDHLLLSPGRLVWEKGHQDVLRAVAALRRGLVDRPAPRVLIVGSGPERRRLEAHADELGILDLVEFKASVPYREMPALFQSATCMVLASLASAGCSLPGRAPRCFWEEQFGYVLVEAMSAGLPVLASTSGAIPEVAGTGAEYFTPGDWLGLARRLADGPLSLPPAVEVEHSHERLGAYSMSAAADRLAAAYDRVLGG